jgi:hypothetical protein
LDTPSISTYIRFETASMLQCWAVLFMLSTSSARRPTACSTTCQTTGCMNLPRWATNAVAPTTHSSCGELLRLILLCAFFSRPLAHGYTAVRGTGLAAAIWPCDACAALLTAVVCCCLLSTDLELLSRSVKPHRARVLQVRPLQRWHPHHPRCAPWQARRSSVYAAT